MRGETIQRAILFAMHSQPLPSPPDSQDAPAADGNGSLLARHRWVGYVLPLAVFLLVGSLEPKPDQPGGTEIGLAIPYSGYAGVYAIKIALTAIAMWLAWPIYREFPRRAGWLSVLVGAAGAAVWIGACRLDVEHRVLQPLLEPWGLGGLIGSGDRSGFNPLEQYAGRPALAVGFLALRFLGLVAIVPVIEEFFLRGFVMRFVQSDRWWTIPFGQLTALAAVAGTAVPMLMHPGELLAAALWFSLVTWLMVRTRSLWDCVAAHATTNALLGLWVITTGDWRLM